MKYKLLIYNKLINKQILQKFIIFVKNSLFVSFIEYVNSCAKEKEAKGGQIGPFRVRCSTGKIIARFRLFY